MEVILNALDKRLVERIGILWPLEFGVDGPNVVEDGVLLIALPEVRHLTRIEHVVDIFEERFIHDLRVSEEERLLRLLQ